MKLSVIIPIYNVEKYIEKCLNSIVQQGVDDIEIVCVDDGSTDRSGMIADLYASKYFNVIVYHQRNQGVAAARNEGLLHASGEYIAWCDPDDYVDLMWKTSIFQGINTGVDCVIIQLAKCRGDIIKVQKGLKRGYIEKNDYIYELSRDRDIKSYLCTHIIKRSILLKQKFDSKINYYEDYDYLTKISLQINKIYSVNRVLYYYVFRDTSLTNRIKPIKYLLQSMKITMQRYRIFKKYGFKCSKEGYLKTYIISYKELFKYEHLYHIDKIICKQIKKDFYNIILSFDLLLKIKVFMVVIILFPFGLLKNIWRWRGDG